MSEFHPVMCVVLMKVLTGITWWLETYGEPCALLCLDLVECCRVGHCENIQTKDLLWTRCISCSLRSIFGEMLKLQHMYCCTP